MDTTTQPPMVNPTDPDKTLIKHTARDQQTLACPLCDYTVDAPPVPISNTLGQAFGMSGATLAAVHAEQLAKRAAHDMRHHLRTHTPEQWLEAPPQLHPAEQLALLAGIGPARDGKPIPETSALMCVLALARLTGKHDWTNQ